MGRIVTLIATVVCTLTGACTIGVVRLQRAVESGPPASGRIAVVELAANAVDAPGPFEAELERLAAAAARAGLQLERVSVPGLGVLLDAGFDAWVLPGQERLSDSDAAAIDVFALTGGGLLLTGPTGRLDAEGRPRAPLPLQAYFPGHRFEARPAGALELRAGPRSVILAGLAPGARLRATAREGLQSLTSGSLVRADDPRLGLGLVSRYRSAPVAWLGVGADALEPEGERLLGSALRWISGLPVVDVRPWPRGHRSAALVTLEVGEDIEAAEAAARELARGGLPPVLAVTAPRAESDPERLRRIAALGEVALAFDPDVDLPAEGRARLERAARHPVSGLVGPIPPGRVTHLRASGYLWATVAGASDAAPRLTGAPDSGLVTLPVSPSPAGGDADVATLVARLLSAQAGVESLDGLFHAALDPGPVARAEGAVTDALARELGSRDVWLTGAGEMAAWWRARAGVRGTLEPLGPRRARLWLRNEGATLADGIAARVYLPARSRPARLSREDWWRPRTRWRVARDHSWIELLAPPLDPGDAVEYILTF